MQVTRATDICEGLIVDLVPSLLNSASSYNNNVQNDTTQLPANQYNIHLSVHLSRTCW